MIKAWWQKKSVRRLSYCLALFGVYLLLLGWAMPALILAKLPQWVATHTNGTLHLTDLRFNPLSWRLQIDQLQLSDDKQRPTIMLEQGIINLEPWHSLFTLTGQISEVQLTEPQLHLIYEHGQLNLQQILPPSQPEPEKAASTNDIHLPLAINRFQLAQGQISYQQDQNQTLQFDKLNINAQQLNFNQANNRMHLTLTAPGKGQLDVELESQLSPLQVAASLNLSKTSLVPYWQFLALPVDFELDSLELALRSHIHLTDDGSGLQAKISQTQIELSQLAISHQQQPLLSLDSFTVQNANLAWPAQILHIDQVALSGGQGNAILTKEGLNWQTIFAPNPTPAPSAPNTSAVATNEHSTTNAAPTTTEAGKPWQWAINDVKLNQWQLNLTDQSNATPAKWQLLLQKLETGALSQDLQQAIAYQLELAINQQGTFALQGEVTPHPLNISSDFHLQRFPLLDTLPYWQQYAQVKLLSGVFSTKGQVQLSAIEPLQLTVSGSSTIDDVLVQDPVGAQDLLKWQTFAVNDFRINTEPLSIDIDEIVLKRPYARMIINHDGSTNLSEIVPTHTPSSEPSAASAHPTAKDNAPLALTIGQTKIDNGEAFFADNRLTPRFATGIEALNGNISRLSTTSSKAATVNIKGQVDRYAPVTLQGSLQPFGAQRDLDLDLTFEHFELTSVNPYAGTYAGYYIDRGQLNLALNYQLEGDKLQGRNNVVINQLELGKPSNSDKATSLPLPLAIALLKNRQGVIDLNLEVGGDIDDPSFNIGAIIWQAITNIVTKAVTAPFDLLGNLLGGKPPADEITFDNGSSALNEQGKTDLSRLAEALTLRPELSITLLGGVAPQADAAALAKQQLAQQLGHPLMAITQKSIWQQFEQLANKELGEETITQLKQQYPDQWQAQLLTQMISAQNITKAELGTLANQRALAVKEALVTEFKVTPGRIFIRESNVQLNTEGAKVSLTLGN